MKKLLAFAWGITLLVGPLTNAYAQETTPPPVSLEVREAPIRSALLQLFDAAKVQYSIDPAVTGFVSLRITDQPFESALRLILRSSPTPLTYSRENGVYFIKPRVLTTPPVTLAPPTMPPGENLASGTPNLEVIQLIYADPYDLAQLLNILVLPIGTRGNGNPSGGTNGAPPRGAGGGMPGGSTGLLGGGGTYIGGSSPGGGSLITGPLPGNGGTPPARGGGNGGPSPRG